MRHLLIATSLAAAFVVPSIADAQTRCQQDQADNRAAGTVLGAVGGALLGSAIAGRHDRAAGAVVGGIGGAVVGNTIASNNGRCPDGYVPVQGPGPGYGPPPGPDPYAGGPGRPGGLREQEDMLANRITAARDRGRLDRGQARDALDELQRIRDREADMRARHGGRLNDDDRTFIQERLDRLSDRLRLERSAGAPPPQPYAQGDIWAGAPPGLRERADWLQARIDMDARRRVLTPGGVNEAQTGLASFRTEMDNLRSRDGGRLRDVDRQYLSDRLDYLARRIVWMETNRR